MFFKDEIALLKIMKMPQPMDARWVKVRNFNKDSWEQVVEGILFEGLMAKFTQNVGCRKYLFKTHGKHLAYCDEKDALLGTGICRFTDSSNYIEKWPGKNLVGAALMKVREVLRKMPAYQEELEVIQSEKELRNNTFASDIMKKFM